MAPQRLRDSLEELICKEAIHTHLQPIVDLRHNQPVGYEALTRGNPGHMLQRPDLMFQAANQFERIPDLEALCIRYAIEHFAGRSTEGQLFLNICPQTLLHFSGTLDVITKHLEAVSLSPRHVVLEISERFPIENADTFIQLINELKQVGYGIAIDDLGSGYSGLKLWSQIRPDYVKIDRHFIDRIDQDPVKQAFVTSVVHLCEQLQCEIIAEGIERLGEMKLLRSLGIHIGQGYLLGKPAREPAFIIPDKTAQKSSRYCEGLDAPVIQLCQPAVCTGPDVTLGEAEALFADNPQLMSVPVLQDDFPLGVLHRHQLLEVFANNNGRTLNECRPVHELMQRDPVIVDGSMTLEAVSRLMTDDDTYYLHQHLIITRDGHYAGLVKTKDLLKRITTNQIQKARYANPLTMLPGNVLIDEHVETLIRQHKPFDLLYADLNHFKPFNDHYGYRQGDNVIRWIGQLLQTLSSEENFVGHVGGDDFIVVSQEEDSGRLCEQILTAFSKGIDAFHDSEDWYRGYLSSTDHNGNLLEFPLLSLVIGVVPYSVIKEENPHTLPQMAVQVRKEAKREAEKNGGNHWQVLSINLRHSDLH